MNSAIVTDRHPRDDLIRVDRLPHIWCPGCGLGKIMGAYTQVVRHADIPLTNQVVVSGIGCTGRTAGYVNLDSYHTTHGRAIPFATGLKLANPKLNVTVISGDGDLMTIGGNHIIHAARRNIDITVIFVNNFNYGMTGGQFGATTPHGARTTTSQKGNYEYPFSMPYLMKACGATYIARWTTLHLKQLEASIAHAFERKGFSFIEVISPCPKGFGKKNKYKDGLDEMRHFESMSMMEEDHDITDIGLDMKVDSNIPVGDFFEDVKPSYLQVKEEFLKTHGGSNK